MACLTGINAMSFAQPAPGGADLLDANIIETLTDTTREPGVLKTRLVDVEEQPFDKAIEASVSRTVKFLHHVSLSAAINAPIKQGDALALSFAMRCPENDNDIGEGLVRVMVQKEWKDRCIEAGFSAGKEWTRCVARGRAPRDFAAGEARINLQLGFRPQRLLIGDLRLINCGQIDVKTLPTKPIAYKRAELSEPWRAAAEERIEEHRKSNVTVEVVDAQGRPVANADVRLRLTNHAFKFGAAYSARYEVDKTYADELPIIHEKFKQLFNYAVLPNTLKWKQYPQKREWAEKAYAWLSANDIPVRGHCLVWPGWNFMPKSIRQYEGDPDKLRQLTMERVELMLNHWRGRIGDWDVTNEIWMQDDLLQVCGDDILGEWFRKARECDGDVRLYYNDANTFVNNQPGHQDHYYATVDRLLKEGVPVDGIGFQSHVRELVPPEVVNRRVERFSRLGPEILVTEFNFHLDGASDETIADYARDYLTVMFSQPKVVGVVFWLQGPLRESGQNPGSAFYTRDWRLKPLGQAWLDLKTKELTTDAKGKTDATGRFTARAFNGDYEVTAFSGGRVRHFDGIVGRGKEAIRCELE